MPSFFAELELDNKRIDKYTSQYPIFSVESKNKYTASHWLGQDFNKIELIARRLSNSNEEYYKLLEDTSLSEVIKLFAIDSAMNYAEYKNAESK